MQKVLASEFDQKAWVAYGANWLRLVKSLHCIGMVVDTGLSSPDKKLLECRVVKGDKFYNTLVNNLKEDERCLVCPCDFNALDMDLFFAESNFVCGVDEDFSLSSDVLTIVNIIKRAEAANLIEQKVIAVYGKPLGIRFMCGDWSNWVKFVGYFDFLVESFFLDPNMPTAAKIAFNLYAANFPGQVVAVV